MARRRTNSSCKRTSELATYATVLDQVVSTAAYRHIASTWGPFFKTLHHFDTLVREPKGFRSTLALAATKKSNLSLICRCQTIYIHKFMKNKRSYRRIGARSDCIIYVQSALRSKYSSSLLTISLTLNDRAYSEATGDLRDRKLYYSRRRLRRLRTFRDKIVELLR